MFAGHGPEFAGLRLDPQDVVASQAYLDELLGTVAHELRTPLVGIVSCVNAITSACDPDPVALRFLNGMEKRSREALRLVDDLFDLCAGGLGKLSLRKEVVALDDVVTRAAESAGPLISARGHRLTVVLPPRPMTLEADPLRLGQVLTNLLCNAAKFTEPGGHIRLSAEAPVGQLVLRVRDNGRGIAPDLPAAGIRPVSAACGRWDAWTGHRPHSGESCSS